MQTLLFINSEPLASKLTSTFVDSVHRQYENNVYCFWPFVNLLYFHSPTLNLKRKK